MGHAHAGAVSVFQFLRIKSQFNTLLPADGVAVMDVGPCFIKVEESEPCPFCPTARAARLPVLPVLTAEVEMALLFLYKYKCRPVKCSLPLRLLKAGCEG